MPTARPKKVLSKTDRDKQKTSANKEISNFYNTPTRTILPKSAPAKRT
jgi:hypothetical protein